MKKEEKNKNFFWAQAQMLTPTSFSRRNSKKLQIRKDLSTSNVEWGEEKPNTITLVFYCWEETSKKEIEKFLSSVKTIWGIEACHYILHKDTGTMVHGIWMANPYVEIAFLRSNDFPIYTSQRVLVENTWNKYEAALLVLSEELGKEYKPRKFTAPMSWLQPPLDYMTELFAEITGKEQYTGRSNKSNFRKKSIEDYAIRMRNNRELWEKKLFSDKLECQKFLVKHLY